MAVFFPPYRRGQSTIGYIVGCSRNRNLINSVPSPQDRIEICRDHLIELQKVMFQEQKKSK
jgi:hypothetical protein